MLIQYHVLSAYFRKQAGVTYRQRRKKWRDVSNMRVKKAAVLGAGTMGAQIAAHLANAGIPTLLLDIPPQDASSEAETRPLGVQDHNAIARAGYEAAKKAKPAAFFTADRAA